MAHQIGHHMVIVEQRVVNVKQENDFLWCHLWLLLAGCGKTHFFMKNLFAPCDKTGFLPLVLPLWGRLQRGKAGCGRPFSQPPGAKSRRSQSTWPNRLNDKAAPGTSAGG